MYKIIKTLILFLIISNVAYAKLPPPGTGGNSVKANVILMLDTSGSMAKIIQDGDTKYPRDLAFDSAGNVYVAKYYDKVVKYDSNGDYVTEWGGYDSGSPTNGKFKHTYSIAVDSSDNVWVSDYKNGRIQKFDSDGTYLSKINLSTSYAKGVEIDSNDNIYAINGNGKIEKYSSSGTLIKKWSNTSAYYIAIDSSDNIYLTTFSSKKVKKYDGNGNLLATYSTSFKNLGIEVDNSGNMYVSDYYGDKIYKYDSSGTLLESWGSWGTALGKFKYPRGIAKDNSGNLWVADYYNHRIQSPDGELLLNATVAETRLKQAKDAIKAIVSNSNLTSGANFGLMRWNTNAKMVVNVSDTGASDIYTEVDTLAAGGWTKLDQAMHKAQQYMKGPNTPMIPGADCQQNILIVISDGYWDDKSASATAKSLFEEKGIKTFTIGFQTTGNNNYVVLSQAGGTYPDSPLYANNKQNLVDVITSYINQIITAQLTFTAPTIMPSVSMNDHILQSTFKYKPNNQWKGYFRKYKLTSTGAIGDLVWDAGVQLNGTASSARNLWTVGNGITAGLNNFTETNLERLREPLENNAGKSYTDDELIDLINFVRGKDSYNEFPNGVDDDGDTLITGERWKLADIYHSEPVVVGAPNAYNSDEAQINSEAYYRYLNGYNDFKNGTSCGGSCLSRDEVIYVGSNGGMMHAFDSVTGNEKWGFIPPSILPNFKDMLALETAKSTSIYGVDASPTIKEIYYNNKWRTVLISGLRQGGHSYFALDITNPDSPEHLFTFAHNPLNKTVSYWDAAGIRTDYKSTGSIVAEYDFSKLGESWSQPIIIKMKISGVEKWVAVIGGGFNSAINNKYASQLFILDLEDGGKIINNIAISDGSGGNKIVNAVPPSVTAVNADSTNLFTHNGALIYFSDLEGKLWKVNLTDSGTLYDITKIFNAEATSSNGRLSFYETAATISSTSKLIGYFGTGDLQNLDKQSSSIQNRGYGIYDDNFPNYTSTTAFTSSSLHNASNSCPSEGTTYGWYINMDTNEKVTGRSAIYNDTVLFSRYTPNSANVCDAGTAKLTEHDFMCGDVEATINLGGGVPTRAVIYNNKVYVGISSDTEDNGTLPTGYTKQGNLIVGTPSSPSTGNVTIESWQEQF